MDATPKTTKAGRAEDKKLKVLIITYYWPPAGGPGVQRWLKFVKYLRDFDIEPVVYVPKNPHYPLYDDSFVSEVPNDITILKHPIKEPYAFAGLISRKKTKTISSGIITDKKQSLTEKVLLWIRGNLFIPDARKLWVKPSVKYLEKYLLNNPVDIMVTTGPPHSLHLIGLKLKEKLGIKWAADFRDPWTTIGYHKKLKLTKSSIKKHKDLERKVLQETDTVIVTSPTTKKELAKITNKPIHIITNGFDTEIAENSVLDSKFTISHIGSLLTERNPKILWEVLAELVNEDIRFAADLQLKFAGAVSEIILKNLSELGLSNYLINLGYISHKEAIELQQKSQVLLLVEIDSKETRSIIPGKLFEYMAASRPILALGPKESDIEKLIASTKTGTFADYTMKDELKATIIKWYGLYKINSLNINPVGVEQYSRKNRTALLAGTLREIVN